MKVCSRCRGTACTDGTEAERARNRDSGAGDELASAQLHVGRSPHRGQRWRSMRCHAYHRNDRSEPGAAPRRDGGTEHDVGTCYSAGRVFVDQTCGCEGPHAVATQVGGAERRGGQGESGRGGCPRTTGAVGPAVEYEAAARQASGVYYFEDDLPGDQI